MHYLSLIYFVNQPLHVSGVFIAHHQEVFTVYVQQLVRVIRLGDWQLWDVLYVRLTGSWPGQGGTASQLNLYHEPFAENIL
jgi:hypothetical protein